MDYLPNNSTNTHHKCLIFFVCYHINDKIFYKNMKSFFFLIITKFYQTIFLEGKLKQLKEILVL